MQKVRLFPELILIFLVAVFFSFYSLERLHAFEYDQERDYQVVKQIVVDHKPTLIGPRVVSSAGFFLAPWYFYLQTPFFVAMDGNPLYGAVFNAVVNIITVFALYLAIFSLSKSRFAAATTSIMWATVVPRIQWNVSFVQLFACLLIWIYSDQIKKPTLEKTCWITLIFSLSLNFHPQMVFLLPVYLYAVYLYFREKKGTLFKNIIFPIVAAILPILPLIIFDLRHEFINLNTAVSFLYGDDSQPAAIAWRVDYAIKHLSTSLAILGQFMQHNTILTLLSLIAPIPLIYRERKYLPIYLIAIFSLITLSFYKAPQWPEYYLMLAGFIIFILVFISMSKSRIQKVILGAFLLYSFISNTAILLQRNDPSSFLHKRRLIQYIISSNGTETTPRITYDFEWGEGLGFSPIYDYYVPKVDSSNPNMSFYVSLNTNKKHNSDMIGFGKFGVSMIY